MKLNKAVRTNTGYRQEDSIPKPPVLTLTKAYHTHSLSLYLIRSPRRNLHRIPPPYHLPQHFPCNINAALIRTLPGLSPVSDLFVEWTLGVGTKQLPCALAVRI